VSFHLLNLYFDCAEGFTQKLCLLRGHFGNEYEKKDQATEDASRGIEGTLAGMTMSFPIRCLA